MSLASVKESSEVIKNAVEIVAVLAAGVWAFFTFVVKDRPTLESHVDVPTELVWRFRGADCIADWNVNIKNIGSGSFEVSRLDVEMWMVDPQKLPRNRFISVGTLRQAAIPGVEHLTFREPLDPLIGTYRPTSTRGHSFEWVFTKPAAPRVLVVTASAFERDHFLWFPRGEKLLQHFAEWSDMCQEPKPPAASPQ